MTHHVRRSAWPQFRVGVGHEPVKITRPTLRLYNSVPKLCRFEHVMMPTQIIAARETWQNWLASTLARPTAESSAVVVKPSRLEASGSDTNPHGLSNLSWSWCWPVRSCWLTTTICSCSVSSKINEFIQTPHAMHVSLMSSSYESFASFYRARVRLL